MYMYTDIRMRTKIFFLLHLKKARSLKDLGSYIDLSPPKGKLAKDEIKCLQDIVNNSSWSKDKNILTLKYISFGNF